MSDTSLSGWMPPDAEPVAHPHGVRAWRERHRERQRLAACLGPVDQRFQRPSDRLHDLAFFIRLFSVMACPLRLSSHGMTIGFFGEPTRPIVDANGMPMSMCVA